MYSWEIQKLLKDIVLEIRNELSKENDVISEESDCKDFTGLCETAYTIFKEKIKELNNKNNWNWEILQFHGELSHTPRTPLSKWPYQHTWMGVKINNEISYVDPTSQQFKDIFKDIPDFYISKIPPKWYYSDRKNPAWNGLTRKLNMKIIIKHKIRDRVVSDGIIEYLQYEVWGKISDLIRKFIIKEN